MSFLGGKPFFALRSKQKKQKTTKKNKKQNKQKNKYGGFRAK